MELPNGTYRARATQGVLGESKSGKEQVVVQFELLEPDYANQTISWYGFFTDATCERTFESLRIMGWQGTNLDDLTGVDANEVSLVIENEEWEGKTRAKVRWVNAVGGMGLLAPLAPDKAKAFAARMRGRVLAFDQSQAMGGKKAAPAQARPAARPNGTHRPSQGVLSPEPPPIAESESDLPF